MDGVRYPIVSVNVGQPALLEVFAGEAIYSAIAKRPVPGPDLWLSVCNLDGDRQADSRPAPSGQPRHGGRQKAVYVYPAAHDAFWADALGQPIPAGAFGENLALADVTERDACIGDTWGWGDAIVQVSGPRCSCRKLDLHRGTDMARRLMRSTGRTGWFLRVLRPGLVPTGGEVTLLERHPLGVSVAQIHTALMRRAGCQWGAELPLDPNYRNLLVARRLEDTLAVL